MAAELLKRADQTVAVSAPPFVMRSTGEEVQWIPSMASKSPVLARLAEGAGGLPDSPQVTTDERGRIVLEDQQFGPEALAALFAFCAGEEPDLRSLTPEQRVDACRCADFYGMTASYRNRTSAALLDGLHGESSNATRLDFSVVPLALGPLVQSVNISNMTISNLTLARCHIASTVFRDCNIDNCNFEASVSTTTVTVVGCRLQRFQICSHCAEVAFCDSDIRDCNVRGGKEVKIDGCTIADVQLSRDANDCKEWTLEVSKSRVSTSMEIPASNTVLCDVSFSRGCRLVAGRDFKLKCCVLSDIQFSCGREDEGCKLEISESVVATPIELPARASILLDDVIFNDGAWFNCDSARITRWSQVRIDGPVKLEDVTFNDRVEGTSFSPGSTFENCNFEFGMGNVAAVECTFKHCKMDSGMKNYHIAHCNFVGSLFEGCAFLPNYPSRGTTLYEAQEANNFSFAKFKQCTLMGRPSAFKFTDPQLSAAWNLHEARLL